MACSVWGTDIMQKLGNVARFGTAMLVGFFEHLITFQELKILICARVLVLISLVLFNSRCSGACFVHYCSDALLPIPQMVLT
uniref:Uncharacterized protein n=1 Tax=Ficedula albicollis TaxID=59894 RepID=A0A803V8K3_FICAL